MGDQEWATEELKALLDQVKELAGTSKMTFNALRGKVKWEKLNIPGKSSDQCKIMFDCLTGPIRKHRYFAEIIEDAKSDFQQGFSYDYCKRCFPDFPTKPPVSAMSLYQAEHANSFPDLNGFERAKTIVKQWSSLSEVEKEQYKEKLSKKKIKYDKKLQKFIENHPTVKLQSDVWANKVIERKRPPMLPTPKSVFIAANLPKIKDKHPSMSHKDVYQKCLDKFVKLKDSKRLKWIRKAEQQLSVYTQECEKFVETHPESKVRPAVLHLSKAEQAILDQSKGKPIAPPRSVFLLFCHKNQHMIEGPMKMAERSHIYSAAYGDLSQKGLRDLKREFRENIEKYVEDFTEYYEHLPNEKKEAEKKALLVVNGFKKILKEKPAEDSSPKKKTKKKKIRTEDTDNNGSDSNVNPAVDPSPKKKIKKKTEDADNNGSDSNVNPAVDPSPKKAKKAKKPKKKDTEMSSNEDSDSVPEEPLPKNKKRKKEVECVKEEINSQPSAASEESEEPSPKKKKTKKSRDVEEDLSTQSPESSPSKSLKKARKNSDPSSQVNSVAETNDALLSFFSPLPVARSKVDGSPKKNVDGTPTKNVDGSPTKKRKLLNIF